MRHMKVLWAIITEDKKCILRRNDLNEYTLTLLEEEYTPDGHRYRVAVFKDQLDLDRVKYRLSSGVQKTYEKEQIKLKFTKVLREVS